MTREREPAGGPSPSGDPALAARAREAVAASGLQQEPEPAPGDAEALERHARRALQAVAQAGLIGELVPAAWRPGGGSPISVDRICAIREELAFHSGLADVMFVMQGLGSCALAAAGTEDLKGRFLPGVARGALIAALALTEPGAGSDLGAIETRAVRDGDSYRLDGIKTFISNAGLADFYTVLARTGKTAPGRGALSAFLVEAATPGLRMSRRLEVIAPHPIGTIELSGCRVPAACRLGDEGGGLDLALAALDRFRPTVGAAACGFARRALDESIRHAGRRRQFGRPLSEFQAIRFKLADMATWLEAARLMVHRAAALLDALPEGTADDRSRLASAKAKLYATEAAGRIADEAVQIHGGLGVTRGQVVERIYREVRALRIYEGTSEIQRSIIARAILRDGGPA